MPATSIKIVPDFHAISHAALRLIVEAGDSAISERGAFTLALSGGPTLEDLYELIGRGVPWDPPLPPALWAKTEFFFTDEFPSPTDAEGTNFTVTDEAMLTRLPLRSDMIHRIRTELGPEDAAKEYGLLLKHRFGAGGPDMALLEMRTDGSVAGLLPQSPALAETHHRVFANLVPGAEAPHVTMTAPFLNRSRHVIVVASGDATAAVLHEVLEGPREPQKLPIQLIQPLAGKLTWIVDAAAAALVSVH